MNLVKANEPWLDSVPANWTLRWIRNIAQLSPGYSDQPPINDELCTVVPMKFLSEAGVIGRWGSEAKRNYE
jgi:hypothetical protein